MESCVNTESGLISDVSFFEEQATASNKTNNMKISFLYMLQRYKRVVS